MGSVSEADISKLIGLGNLHKPTSSHGGNGRNGPKGANIGPNLPGTAEYPGTDNGHY
jgi:hypothetical protein